MTVGVMALVKRVGAGRRVGLVPSEERERGMWWIWVPIIVAWIALPAIALDQDDPPLSLPVFAQGRTWVLAVRWIAAVGAATCFLLTTICWIRMGKSWAIAVVPGVEQPLVTSGPYRLARHPIYALSVAMIACSFVVLPTWPMAVVAIAHIVLMNLKARGEERHLVQTHGDAYRDYARRVGRFFPRPRQAS